MFEWGGTGFWIGFLVGCFVFFFLVDRVLGLGGGD